MRIVKNALDSGAELLQSLQEIKRGEFGSLIKVLDAIGFYIEKFGRDGLRLRDRF